MKRRKGLTAAACCALLCLFAGSAASAFEVEFERQEGLKSVLPSENELRPMGYYMAVGECAIYEIGTGRVRIMGYTKANRVVETITADVFLYQKTDKGTWAYQTEMHLKANNTYVIEGTKDWSVARKHYYRVEAGHHAYGADYHDATVSNTNSMYIG